VTRRVQLVFFALGLAFFVWLVSRIGARTIIVDLGRTGWVFVPIVLVWGVVYITNTIAWLTLAEDGASHLPFARGYTISVASFAINYITPMISLGGEPFKIAASARWLGGDTAASSVVAFRVVHTLGQFVFWILTIPIAYALLPHTTAIMTGLGIATLALLIGALLLAVLMRASAIEPLLAGLATRFVTTPLLGRVARLVLGRRTSLAVIDSALLKLARERTGALAFALLAEVSGRFIAMLEYFLIARSVGIDIGYPTAVLIGGFSQLVLNLFFFIPFEMGSKEGGLYLIFELLHLPPGLGVYTAIVSRLRELAWIAIGLLFIWLSGGAASARGLIRSGE
jgi:lysylphosphatidylglycerol synthase-like protein